MKSGKNHWKAFKRNPGRNCWKKSVTSSAIFDILKYHRKTPVKFPRQTLERILPKISNLNRSRHCGNCETLGATRGKSLKETPQESFQKLWAKSITIPFSTQICNSVFDMPGWTNAQKSDKDSKTSDKLKIYLYPSNPLWCFSATKLIQGCTRTRSQKNSSTTANMLAVAPSGLDCGLNCFFGLIFCSRPFA